MAVKHSDPQSIVGKKYAFLTVIEYIGRDEKSRRKYRCLCDCGNETIVLGDSILTGNTKSCGCYHDKLCSDRLRSYITKHGLSKTRLYKIWKGMRYRCAAYNKDVGKYYADRGIAVCDEWKRFETFFNWSIENGYNDGLTIDRIDVNQGYYPENCRWITVKEQQRNKTNTLYVLYNGRNIPLKEACEMANIDYMVAYMRIKRLGWTIEKALRSI